MEVDVDIRDLRRWSCCPGFDGQRGGDGADAASDKLASELHEFDCGMI